MRGKHQRRAELRREEATVSATMDDYQRKVVRLTAKNRELQDRLATMERNAKATERRLRAERDEGVSEKVQALSLALRSAVTERDKARSESKADRDLRHRTSTRMCSHMINAHGMSVDDARAWWLMVTGGATADEIGEEDRTVFPVDEDEERLLRRDSTTVQQILALRDKKQHRTYKSGQA